MSLTTLINNYETAAIANPDIGDFVYGRVHEINLLKQKTFPVCLVVCDEGKVIPNQNKTSFETSVYVIDNYHNDEKSTVKRREKFDEVRGLALNVWSAGLNAPDHYIDNRTPVKVDMADEVFNEKYVVAHYSGTVVVSDCAIISAVGCPTLVDQLIDTSAAQIVADIETAGKTAEVQSLICGSASSIVADFSAPQTTTEEDQPLQFTDLSTGSPTNWVWDFGDGTMSTDQNPTHTYETPGTYTVTLIAANYTAGDLDEKIGYVTVTQATFNPSQLPLLWYLKSSEGVERDGSGTPAEDGNGVLFWRDQAGSFDFTQVFGSSQPTFKANSLNSMPSLVFGGTNDFMENASALSFMNTNGASGSFFAIYKNEIEHDGAVWSSIQSNNISYYRPIRGNFSTAGNQYFKRDINNSSQFGSYGTKSAGWHYIIFIDNGTTADIYQDGSLVATNVSTDVGDQTLDNTYIGRGTATGQYFNGEIVELFAMSGVLSQQDIDNLNGYAQNTYNLT